MTNVKQQNQLNTFYITYKNKKYIINIEYLKNTTYGAPRYKAVIIPLLDVVLTGFDCTGLFHYVYTFTGSYRCLYDEAISILKYAIDEEEKDK